MSKVHFSPNHWPRYGKQPDPEQTINPPIPPERDEWADTQLDILADCIKARDTLEDCLEELAAEDSEVQEMLTTKGRPMTLLEALDSLRGMMDLWKQGYENERG